jgi:hypothetical protein
MNTSQWQTQIGTLGDLGPSWGSRLFRSAGALARVVMAASAFILLGAAIAKPPNDSNSPTDSTGALLPAGFLSTRGSQIVGPQGSPVRVAGVGLTGMNVVAGQPQLEGPFKGIEGHVAPMRAIGFNCVRVDWIDRTLDDAGVMAQLDALIICEAIINCKTGACEGDLSVARSLPIVLSDPAKLVCSVHEYPKEIGGYRGPESGGGCIERMNKTWGWLASENVAPVWIGEMGASMISPASRAWG